MRSKLVEVCDDILEDETKTRKFLALETMEDMYVYFSDEITDLTREEFDGFVVDMLEEYSNWQSHYEKVNEGSLSDVSGGANQSTKVTAGLLALMSSLAIAFPQAGAIKNNIESGSSSALMSNNSNGSKSLVSNVYNRTKNWIKKHPVLAGIGLATLVLGGKCAYERTRPWYGLNRGTVDRHDVFFGRAMTGAQYLERVINERITDEYFNALCLAAESGSDYYVIKLLNVIGPNRDILNRADHLGTPLMYAIMSNSDAKCSFETIKALLDCGSDPNVRVHIEDRGVDWDAWNRAMVTPREDTDEILDLLLQHGYRLSPHHRYGGNGETQTKWCGMCLLNCAARSHPFSEQCKLWIKAGADVKVTDRRGDTLLVSAARRGNTDMVRALLAFAGERVADDRANARRAAAENRHQDIVRLLG